MSNERLNLASITSIRFHRLNFCKQSGIFPDGGMTNCSHRLDSSNSPIMLYWISRREAGTGSPFSNEGLWGGG